MAPHLGAARAANGSIPGVRARSNRAPSAAATYSDRTRSLPVSINGTGGPSSDVSSSTCSAGAADVPTTSASTMPPRMSALPTTPPTPSDSPASQPKSPPKAGSVMSMSAVFVGEMELLCCRLHREGDCRSKDAGHQQGDNERPLRGQWRMFCRNRNGPRRNGDRRELHERERTDRVLSPGSPEHDHVRRVRDRTEKHPGVADIPAARLYPRTATRDLPRRARPRRWSTASVDAGARPPASAG